MKGCMTVETLHTGICLQFTNLVAVVLYCDTILPNRHCLGYCYADLISESLAEFVTLWNGHYIRKTKGARCPGGIPDVLYRYPESAGKQCEIL